MSNDRNGMHGRRPSRRDFLSTSAKVGAGLAIAGSGLDLAAGKASAAGITSIILAISTEVFPSRQAGCAEAV